MRQTEFLATACDPKTLTVGQLMQDAVFTCGSRTDALTISRLMTQRNFGSLPVVEEDRTLVGLISEYDLLQAMIDGRDLRKIMAVEMMSTHPVTATHASAITVLSVSEATAGLRRHHLHARGHTPCLLGDVVPRVGQPYRRA